MPIGKVGHLSTDTIFTEPIDMNDGHLRWPIPRHIRAVDGIVLTTWGPRHKVLVSSPDYNPWALAEDFMKLGLSPPLAVVKRLGLLDRKATLSDQWVVRGARRTARAVEQAAREQVRHVHHLKQSLRSSAPRQLILPLGFGGHTDPPGEA